MLLLSTISSHPVYEGPYSGVVRLLFSCCGDGMRRSSRRGAEVGLPGRHVVKMPEVMCTTRAWLSADDVGRLSVGQRRHGHTAPVPASASTPPGVGPAAAGVPEVRTLSGYAGG